MGKGKRIRNRKKDEQILQPFRGRDRSNDLDVACPVCGHRGLYYLSWTTGILRCDCGWQGFLFLDELDGRYVMIPTEETMCLTTAGADGAIEIQLALGPCRVLFTEELIIIEHERGDLCYSRYGHLLAANGIFVYEHVRSPRPPPCSCGSFNVEWISGTPSYHYLTDAAERLGRKVEPIRCMGDIWLKIDGFGGRVARCRDCSGVIVLPTICDEESDWRKEVEAKKMSVFISYGGPDEEIAGQISHALTKKGVRTWFFPKDAIPGEKLHRTMFNGVNEHDRFLLVCSRASLSRPGVLNEIERVLEREGREGGTSRLLPITLDKHVFSDWAPSRPDLAQQVRDRVICDFTEAAGEGWSFHDKIDQLARALERNPNSPAT